MLLPFPLVAQNYSHYHGNFMEIPWEWEFPFLCTPLLPLLTTSGHTGGSDRGFQRSVEGV